MKMILSLVFTFACAIPATCFAATLEEANTAIGQAECYRDSISGEADASAAIAEKAKAQLIYETLTYTWDGMLAYMDSGNDELARFNSEDASGDADVSTGHGWLSAAKTARDQGNYTNAVTGARKAEEFYMEAEGHYSSAYNHSDQALTDFGCAYWCFLDAQLMEDM